MHRLFALALAGAALLWAPPLPAQQPPTFATTKVEGTDNVYIFRYLNHQAMFVVTSAGVIATDPIGYVRREAPTVYLQEIRKVTDKPVKYLIYSHHHYDHIAGGKPFKDAGAIIVAHKRAKERLAQIKDPFTVLPDEVFERKRTIVLGDTTLELIYLGLNHSEYWLTESPSPIGRDSIPGGHAGDTADAERIAADVVAQLKQRGALRLLAA